MKRWWVYEALGDEKGCIVKAATPREALGQARRRGWRPWGGGEIWCYELGDLHSLGRNDDRVGVGASENTDPHSRTRMAT